MATRKKKAPAKPKKQFTKKQRSLAAQILVMHRTRDRTDPNKRFYGVSVKSMQYDRIRDVERHLYRLNKDAYHHVTNTLIRHR